MLVLRSWLQEYVDIQKLSDADISETLTGLGLEVEGVEQSTPTKGDVVTCLIESVEQHPDADKLFVCQVNIGKDEPIQIVTNSKSAKTGVCTAVALHGSYIGCHELKIKKGKMRGVVSQGMFCSDLQIGRGSDDSDIVIFTDAPKPGMHTVEHFHLKDSVFELSITPNRGDCLSYIGLAREIVAKKKLVLKSPKISLDHLETYQAAFEADNQVADLCPRFSLSVVKGIKVGETPIWMKNRLEKSGVRSINSAVDVTNYVLLERGQPIHAYDRSKLSGSKLTVRQAKQDEQIQTLDGEDRKLLDGQLVIANADKPVALAGVMGGSSTQVDDQTIEVVIEAACFDPVSIRKASKHFALHSDSSHRFERGVDLENVMESNKRVVQLLAQVATENNDPLPSVCGHPIDHYPVKAKQIKIAVRPSFVSSVLGIPFLRQESVENDLARLGINTLDKADDRLLVEVPSWRNDLNIEVDIVEEFGRMFGLNSIPSKFLATKSGSNFENPLVKFTENLRSQFASSGFHEVFSYSFIGEAALQKLVNEKSVLLNYLKVKNPISDDTNILQPTLMVNMITKFLANKNLSQSNFKLFEVARCFLKPIEIGLAYWDAYQDSNTLFTSKATSESRPLERLSIAGIVDATEMAHWQSKQKHDFYSLKSDISKVLSSLGIHTSVSIEGVTDTEWLHPGKSALIKAAGTVIGYIGELHPATCASFDIKGQAPLVFELDVQRIFGSAGRVATKNRVSGFPPSRRDLGFLLEKAVPCGDVEKVLTGYKQRKNLKSWRLFDIYEGDNIPEDKKSMTFELVFQSSDKTLKDKEVDREFDFIISALKNELAVEFR